MVHGVAFGRLEWAVVVVVHDFAFCLTLADNLHLAGIAATQRHLEVHDAVFYGVLQRGVEHRLDGDTLDETHLDNALAEGAVTCHADHDTTFTGL